MENKITVEQFKEWLKEDIEANGDGVSRSVLRTVLAKASQIAEPTADLKGKKLTDLKDPSQGAEFMRRLNELNKHMDCPHWNGEVCSKPPVNDMAGLREIRYNVQSAINGDNTKYVNDRLPIATKYIDAILHPTNDKPTTRPNGVCECADCRALRKDGKPDLDAPKPPVNAPREDKEEP